MPFSMPSSLSPHICTITSSDLENLLEYSSLPPLHHILQSFSPLPQVTTRTTSLVSVPHSSFALRFSTLDDVELACREDDEERAVRTLDWMTARISNRSAKWVQDTNKLADKDGFRTLWWDELRRCAEGDFVPSKSEAWNHPVALILAVSTTTPNPLQAITALYSRALQFPPWVDSNFLRYTLIIHPQDSALSDEEAGALFNAVKKQFGLHSYLLNLSLPKPPPKPIPVPALMPRLPSPPSPDASPQNPITLVTATIPTTATHTAALNTLSMEEKDIQQTARFTREFLVMSLVPWMEKCVVDWNENFSSTRRLPSRLFSSTRRLFGSPSPSPSPVQLASSVAPLPGRTSVSGTTIEALGPPSQLRRLAEFATILGDYKLAVMVWEALRKESKGGSDILPLLLTPSPAIPLHASTALTSIHSNSTEVHPHAQVRALLCAVRWEAGISAQDFSGTILEGERWLVWAAGNAEEAPSALLLAHAALLSAKKQAKRRAALWYTSAAGRLEKCGIKPLTIHFLRKAQELVSIPSPKELSPSFWDSEGKSGIITEGLEDILSGIEHPLGRMLYTTGDVAGAVQLFLGLLRGTATFSYNTRLHQDGTAKIPGNDKVYLDDFRVAYSYFKSTEPDKVGLTSLQLPIKFCATHRLRLRFLGDNGDKDNNVWNAREEDWKTFWKSQGGKESVARAGKVSTNELFWVDLVLQNPLDTEVNLSNLTLIVQPSRADSTNNFVEVEVIKEVTLGAKETSSIPVSLKSKVPMQLSITHAKYDFLGLLSVTEPLASCGRRLHDTPSQRQQPTYAPDVIARVEVVASHHKLVASYIEDDQLVLMQGENKSMRLWLTNAGSGPIGEVWMVTGAEDEIWVGAADNDVSQDSTTMTEVIRSQNSLELQKPYRLSISGSNQSSSEMLEPGNSLEIPFIFHAETIGSHELCLLFVFRENDTQPFYSTKLTRSYDLYPLFDISISAEPSQILDYSYVLNTDIVNVSTTVEVELVQISCLSPSWTAMSLTDSNFGVIAPSQCFRLVLGSSSWSGGSGSQETLDFVSRKLRHLLQGKSDDSSTPPHVDVHCSHVLKVIDPSMVNKRISIQGAAIMHFIQSGRRKFASQTITDVHSYIAPTSHPLIFPLYNPASLDMIVFWTIPLRNISGHVNVPGIRLGAGHAALDGLIEEVESAKVKRSMYAETRRENREVLDAIRGSEWNAEMNPVVLSLPDVGTKTHDFSKGPFILPLEFLLRNHSLTHPARYTLNLMPKLATPSRFLPLPYQGRLTFRGVIPSSHSVVVQSKVWITRAGSYEWGGWTLETEIDTENVADPTKSMKKRRYLQETQLSEGVCLTVCDARTS